MLKNLLYLILLFFSIPFGLFLARLCKEEIKNWKKRLIIFSVFCLIFAFIIFFIPTAIYLYKLPTIIGLFFMIIVFLTIIWKSR
jgi:hypothetical protein